MRMIEHVGTVPACTPPVAHLVDRQPTVSPERLIVQLTPPPAFAEVSFASYHPDPAEPSQAAAVAACQQFCDAGHRAPGGPQETVRQARTVAGYRALPRRWFRRRQDASAGRCLPRAARRCDPSQSVRDVHGADPACRGVRIRRMHRAVGRLHAVVHRRVRAGRPG